MTTKLEAAAQARHSVLTAHSHVIAHGDNESHDYLDEALLVYRYAIIAVDPDRMNSDRQGESFRNNVIEAGRQAGIFWFDVEERARKLVQILESNRGDDEVARA